MVAREVLINIFPGIRREIKLTARICESFVTPAGLFAALPIVPSHVAFEISLVLALAERLYESQFFSVFNNLDGSVRQFKLARWVSSNKNAKS